MVGILIVAHGSLGESLIHCASHVMGGRPPNLAQMGVGIQDDPQKLLPEAIRLVQSLDQGQGVLGCQTYTAPRQAISPADCWWQDISKALPESTCRCWSVP